MVLHVLNDLSPFFFLSLPTLDVQAGALYSNQKWILESIKSQQGAPVFWGILGTVSHEGRSTLHSNNLAISNNPLSYEAEFAFFAKG